MGPFKKRRSPVTYPTISLLEVLSEISDLKSRGVSLNLQKNEAKLEPYPC